MKADLRFKRTYELARDLMREHGALDQHGWRFAFDRAKMRAGQCDYSAKIISLSKHYVAEPSVPFEDIRNTILHEIAHALAGDAAGHGPEWKRVALSIGCDGSRYNHVWYGARKAWKIYCDCGHVKTRRHRITAKFRDGVCARCHTMHVRPGERRHGRHTCLKGHVEGCEN